MTKLKFLVVFGILVAGALGQPEPETTAPSAPTTIPAKPTTAPTTAPTTTPKTTPTTTPTTTTTTIAPTTTSTTAKPTPPITTPTTPATKPTTPATTTVAPSTRAPTPPKPVDPKIQTWVANFTGSNDSCIIAKLAMQVEIPYVTKTNQRWTAYIDLDPKAQSIGACGNNTMTQNITMQWDNNSVAFIFAEDSYKHYSLDRVEIIIVPNNETFPNANDTSTFSLVHKHHEFNTTLHKSYKCPTKSFDLTTLDNENKTVAFVHFSHLQVQAFCNTTGPNFLEATECESDSPDIIPIAAGCALGVLICTVLGVYLWGRRRSQVRGYLSMFTQNKREEDYIPMKNLSCFN